MAPLGAFLLKGGIVKATEFSVYDDWFQHMLHCWPCAVQFADWFGTWIAGGEL